MITITPHMRILLATEPVDFRKGIDGLAGVCRNILDTDPFAGYLFVFVNKKRTSLKILVYDGQGFWLCQKRLSKDRFEWWPAVIDPQGPLPWKHTSFRCLSGTETLPVARPCGKRYPTKKHLRSDRIYIKVYPWNLT